jgi:hypothetical protein
MKNKLTAAFVLAILLSVFAIQTFAANPDLSGTWTLDLSKSEGLPPGMKQEMTVTQTGDKISLETKLITDQGERVVPDFYMLDGKETEFAPKTPDGTSGKGKRAAKWTADGIEVTETATFDTPDGSVTVKTDRKWTLSADGKALKIEITQQLPNGETKKVSGLFNRK